MMSRLPSFPLIGLILSISGFCGPLVAQKLSQQVLATTGLQAEQSGIQLSYTVGEPMGTILVADTLMLTQGFHQHFPPGSVAIHEIQPGLTLFLYPNPFSDFLYIRFQGNPVADDLKMMLFHVSGQLAGEYTLSATSDTHTIPLNQLPPGIYTVQIWDKTEQILHTSNVIKVSGY